MRPDELLVVVPAELVRAAEVRPGFDRNPRRVLDVILQPGAARALARSRAEEDPRYKQLVAYVALRWQGRIYHYQRSARVGEQRLAGRRSLGIGGHVNAADYAFGEGAPGLARAFRRELAEEVELSEEPAIRYVGIVNEDRAEVGRVHLGVVAVVDLREPLVRLRDSSLLDGRFDPPEAIAARLDEFEGWSQLCFPALSSGD